MSQPALGFRTVTHVFITRYYYDSLGQLQQVPISLPITPSTFELNPGISSADIDETSSNGETVIALTYIDKTAPEITMEFGVATPEVESLIINRVALAGNNYTQGYVYFHAVCNTANIAGVASTEYGNEVPAQSAASNNATVYRLDPLTKLAVPLTVVDSSPIGDQIVIGAGLNLTVSAALEAAQTEIYGLIRGVAGNLSFANYTYLSNEVIPYFGVYAVGICFDNTIKLMAARLCSFLPSGSFTKDPKRQIKLRVLNDPNALTGLGYDIIQLQDANPVD